MEPKDRISLIKGLRDTLIDFDYVDLELYLTEHGLPSVDGRDWSLNESERSLFLTKLLQNAEDSQLIQLSRSLESQPIEQLEPLDSIPKQLEVFISHPSSEAEYAHALSAELELFGIESFVAHDDIVPNAQWRTEIEKKLNSSSAGIAVLCRGFHDSDWCEQEVGWLRGRKVALVSLKIDEDPRGPLAERQAVGSARIADQDVLLVLTVFDGDPDLHAHLLSSYIEALRLSPRFSVTDKVWDRLRKKDGLSLEHCALLWWSAKMNSQVAQALCRPEDNRASYPTVIREYIENQHAFIRADVDLPGLIRIANSIILGDEDAIEASSSGE